MPATGRGVPRKDPSGDLDSLFAAALEEEETKSKPASAAKSSTRPVTSGGVARPSPAPPKSAAAPAAPRTRTGQTSPGTEKPPVSRSSFTPASSSGTSPSRASLSAPAGARKNGTISSAGTPSPARPSASAPSGARKNGTISVAGAAIPAPPAPEQPRRPGQHTGLSAIPRSKSVPPTTSGRTRVPTDIRGKPATQLTVDPAEASDALDHKGRSKPLYARRSIRPQQAQPPRALDLLLGLFPGARMMARERVASGMTYTVLGLFSLILAVIVLVGWSSRVEKITALGIHPRWLLLHSGVVLISVTLFEALRLASSMDLIRGRLRLTRALAALTLPCLVVLLGAPALLAYAPGPLELAWIASLVGVAIALIATVDSVHQRSDEEASGGIKLALGGTASVLIVAGVTMVILWLDHGMTQRLAAAATEAGFQIIPRLLALLG